MAGTTLVLDSFTGLGLGVTNHGRVPATTNTGNAWIEESGKHSVGGGSNDLKYVAGGASKMDLNTENFAVRVRWYDGGVANNVWISVRDSVNTAYPRHGYVATFHPRDAKIQVYTENNFTFTQLGTDVAATYDTVTGINDCVFEVNGDNFRVIVNDVLVHSFTNTMFQANGTRDRFSMLGQVTVNGDGRLQEVEIYDSYVIPGDIPPSIPLVLVL